MLPHDPFRRKALARSRATGFLTALLLAAVAYPAAAANALPPANNPAQPPGVVAPVPPPAASPNALIVPDADQLSDADIQPAITKGADFLFAQLDKDIDDFKKQLNPQSQKKPAFFSFNSIDQLGGQIAISVYALLTLGRITGEPRYHFTSKEMEGPIKFLVQMRTQYTYALGLQASALSMLPNRPDLRKPLAADLEELLRGNKHGFYTYSTNPDSPNGRGTGDHSNTQYGQLGVWAAQDAGLEVPNSYWEAVDQHWRNTQNPSGGWAYSVNRVVYPPNARNFDGSTATMTAAGTASLFLAQDQLDRSVSYNPRPDKSIDAGLKWLADQYPTFKLQLPTNLYLAYGIERVALSGGIKTFAQHDWYREGATLIINAQRPDGSWGSAHDTAYALLFLARGIAPIVAAKLEYPGPWNARGRDCARFVRWFNKQTEKALNWQVISLDTDPAEWQNVPVLVITGHDDPKFTPQQIAKLKRYVENGGLIFSSADDANAPFTKAIRQKYAPALFDNAYEMRALPEDHPVFNVTYQIPPKKQPHLFGLSNGVREVWIHSAGDITAAWQSYSIAKTQYFEVPANIYFYAMGKTQFEIRYPPLAPPAPPPATSTLNLARIIYSGNWDPEPTAWEHFAAQIRREHAAVLHVIPTKIADLDPAKTPIAHISGTTAFTLNHDDLAKLADYLAKGGTLLADSAGGNTAFAASLKANVAILFPNSPFGEIPDKSPILTGTLAGGSPIKSPEVRRFAELPQNRDRPLVPWELKQNGKPVIVFSPGDLTAGLADLNTWGIRGYTPDTAAAITWNALLYLTSKTVARAPAAAANLAPTTVPTTTPAGPASLPATHIPPAPPG